MNTRFLFVLLALFQMFVANSREKPQSFDRPAFYNAMESGTVDGVNLQLDIVKSSTIEEKQAFEGALLMKKASLVLNKKEKLQLFKSGRSKLESSLLKNPGDVECRLLRLIIQENAPKVVKYNGDINKDSDYIRKFYKSQSPAVQAAIMHYAKSSKVLELSAL